MHMLLKVEEHGGMESCDSTADVVRNEEEKEEDRGKLVLMKLSPGTTGTDE